MSQATDILQKILQLEEHKGFQDTAVTGGLTGYADRWAAQARARQPGAEPLINAIRDTLLPYSEQGRSSREVRLRRALDLLGRLAAGDVEEPDDGTGGATEEAAPKKRTRRATPTVSPLTMATVQSRSAVPQTAVQGGSLVSQTTVQGGSPIPQRVGVPNGSLAPQPETAISADAARSAH